MPTSVPAASFFGALFSLVVALGVPVGLGIAVCRRRKGAFHSIIIGAFCFIVGAYVLEQILHTVVLIAWPGIRENALAFTVYGCLAAGVFEESARLFGLRALCKRDPSAATGFAYGVGHGGIEAIMLVGVSMVNNLVIMTMINSGNAQSLVQGLEGDQLALAQDQLTQLATLPSDQWFAAGFERLCALTLHLALSMLVWMVVTRRLPMWGYGLSIALHAVANVPAALYQCGIGTIWITEIATCVLTAGVAVLVSRLYRRAQAPAA